MKTKTKQLGQTLTQKDFSALLTALNETALVSVTDAKGDIIYANEKFVKTAGYSLKELIGQSHRILKSGQQPDKMFDNLWKTISSGKVWRGEIKNKAKDGTYYWVDTSIAPILNDQGTPERYIAVRFLITDRKQQELEYTASLTALNQTALVSMTDVKGNITYANEMFVATSKYSLEELIGQNHRILKSGQQPNEMFDNLWKTVSSGKVWRGEIKNKAKDGTYYWVDTSIAPILNDVKKPEKYIAIRFLISDKKKTGTQLEEQIVDMQKLNDLMVGRELTMIKLKEKIKELESQLKTDQTKKA